LVSIGRNIIDNPAAKKSAALVKMGAAGFASPA
jgi:hypothetical protein